MVLPQKAVFRHTITPPSGSPQSQYEISMMVVGPNRPTPIPQPRQRVKSILKSSKSTTSLRDLANHSRVTSEIIITPSKHLFDDIPPEIVDSIFFYLRHDRRSLLSCTLVCKAWLTLARSRLMPYGSKAYVVNLDNVGEVYELLKPPYATIHQHIPSLAVYTQRSFTDPFFTLQNGERKVWLKGDPKLQLHSVLRRFTTMLEGGQGLSLRSLKLNLGNAQTDELVPIIETMPYLTDIELRSAAFSSFEQLCMIICAPKQLHTLTLTDVNWKKAGAKPKEPSNGVAFPSSVGPGEEMRMASTLMRLQLFIRGNVEFLSWLTTAHGPPPIRALCIGGINDADSETAVAYLLQALGPELKHFKMYTRCWGDEVKLTHNVSLQSLSISHYILGNTPESTERLVAIFNDITSPNIARITLEIILQNRDHLDFVDWESVEDALLTDRFPKLKCVNFRVPGRRPVVRRRFARWLPALMASGILFVEGDGRTPQVDY